MEILLTEQQILMLESEQDNWGCNLFPNNSEQKDWCRCSMNRVSDKSKKEAIQNEINRIAKFLKNEKDLSETIKYYKEDDPFFSDNIDNLNELYNLLFPSCKVKTKNTIDNFKRDLAEKFLFVNKEDDKFTYSLLNKLNTNYSGLSYLLTNFRERFKLKDRSFDDIFDLYFKPTYKNEGNEVNESKFFNLIVNYFSKDSIYHEESKKIIDDTLKTIRGTDEIGKNTENQAYEYLKNKFGENNVKNFSGDYSWVDFLGVDMVIYNNNSKEWIPVQIKTNVDQCKPNYRFCKNVCIGKNQYKKDWEIREYK
jgi:hypothetical protein